MSQIEQMKKLAERQRKEEYASIIKAIKKQIADYGITATDLGFSGLSNPSKKNGKSGRALLSKRKKSPKRPNKESGTRKTVAPKYRDEAGNTWSGRGKTPRWLSSALSSGLTIDSFLIK
jgi:DNA-binding protein H-NS